jgi:hypothetical protein
MPSIEFLPQTPRYRYSFEIVFIFTLQKCLGWFDITTQKSWNRKFKEQSQNSLRLNCSLHKKVYRSLVENQGGMCDHPILQIF